MGSSAALIGRERELAELGQAIGRSRMVTLTGPGGSGKTRVALELSRRLADRAGPLASAVVELAVVRGAERVLDVVLRTMDIRERGGRTRMDVLVDRLVDREMLLVLDNCEHLAAEVGRLAAELLEHVPGVRLLVSSREPIGVAGELVVALPPLSLPEAGGDVAAVVRSDAGRLFVDRASAADPGFALTPASARSVVRICRALDGLPLALELAAARVVTISTADIAEGIARHGRLAAGSGDGGLPQHHSIRASLDWSLQLLDPDERRLLRRLATFTGGFSTAGARAVCLPEATEEELHGLLDGLQAKGLIVEMSGSDERRWTFLETVGEFATEELVLSGEHDDARERHSAWFTAFAAAVEETLLEPGGRELIDLETANLRSALDWMLEHDAQCALTLVASLMPHWILAERFAEGSAASAAVLALADDRDPAARALVHSGAGVIGTLSEDYESALGDTYAGLALLGEIDDLEAVARCLQLSAMVLILTGIDLPAGLENASRAVELMRSSGNLLGLAWGLVNVAMSQGLCDQFDAVHTAYEEYVTIPGASEQVRLRTWAELAAAWAELIAGSPERALEHADLALGLEGDWPSMTHFILTGNRVHALALMGRTDEATAEGLRALSRAHETGALMAAPAIEMALAIAALMDGEDEVAERRARPLLQMPQTHTVALMHEVLAQAALARGDAAGVALHAEELLAVAGRSGSARHRAVSSYLHGCAATLDAEHERARDLLHAALAVDSELGLERGAADALEQLAVLAAIADDTPRCARLAASAAAARARLGCAPLPFARAQIAAARARLIDRDGEQAWADAWAEGSALALAEAIAYARRGRGPRDRPAIGWASLTPGEQQVAELAARGSSNPEIATALFISRSTVKMHLSSVYQKLGVANRTELARSLAIAREEASSAW